MKTISTKAIIAMMTATLGLTAIAPAMAQTATPAPQAEASRPDGQPGPNGFRPGPDRPQRGGGFGDFFNLERGAEAIEIAVVRLTHRLDLSAEQKTLLDTLKADALTAADTFASATKGLRPTAPAEGQEVKRPDFTAALDTKIALDSARLAALQAIQPAATAFFDSLSDEQKAQLTPQQGERGGPGKRGDLQPGGPHHHGPHGAPNRG